METGRNYIIKEMLCTFIVEMTTRLDSIANIANLPLRIEVTSPLDNHSDTHDRELPTKQNQKKG